MAPLRRAQPVKVIIRTPEEEAVYVESYEMALEVLLGLQSRLYQQQQASVTSKTVKTRESAIIDRTPVSYTHLTLPTIYSV